MDGIIIFIASLVVIVATSLIKTVRMSTKQKSTVAVATSAVAGLATAWINSGGDLAGGDALQSAVLVFGASQAIYNFILKGTPADEILEKSFGGGNKSAEQAKQFANLLSDIAATNKPAKAKKTTAKKAPAKKPAKKVE
jgi:hypothetical protein